LGENQFSILRNYVPASRPQLQAIARGTQCAGRRTIAFNLEREIGSQEKVRLSPRQTIAIESTIDKMGPGSKPGYPRRIKEGKLF
jgi:hypothetical protein